MRFSIRWMLAVTAYVALVAAAIAAPNPMTGTQTPFLVDLVWAVPLLIFCYAAVVACVDRGRRQAMAIGFVVLSTTHVVCNFLAPNSVPAAQLYKAAGFYISSQDGPIYEETATSTALSTQLQVTTKRLPTVRTSNGVFTLVAGLVGCWIGALAYKHKRSG